MGHSKQLPLSPSNPTCVSWDWDGRGLIIGWQHSAVELWDVELGRAVTTFEHADFGNSQVNCLVKHPTETLIIAGYEDRNIRIFDTRTRISLCLSNHRGLYKFMGGTS
jgi:WD40 repeat protein